MSNVVVYEGLQKVIREALAGEVPTQAEMDAANDERAERLTRIALERDAVDKALAKISLEIVRSLKTGNLTYWDTVTDAATFRALVKSLIRTNLEG